MKVAIVTLLASSALVACASSPTSRHRYVTIDELISHPARYRGEQIRVSGYLVSMDGGLQVLDSESTHCYGEGKERRRYATTDLPRSVMGKVNAHPTPFGPKFTFHGRLVVVAGIFEGSVRPWGDEAIGDVPLPAAGPIKNARIIEMSDKICIFSPEGSALGT